MKQNCSFVCSFAIMIILTLRRRERRVHTENNSKRMETFAYFRRFLPKTVV